MEQVVASYLRQLWYINDWLYEGQHGFMQGFSCESQVTSVCQDIADSLDNEARLDAIIIDFSKAFDLVPRDRLLTKVAASGMELRVVVSTKEFLLGRTQRVRGGGQLSEEVRVNSGVPQVRILGPLLFLAYVNDIWKKTDSTIRLFADDCVMHRKTVNNNDVENLQIDLGRLGEWAVENGMKVNPGKSIAVSFVRARVKDPLNYPLLDQVIPQASSCKYLGIILRSDLTWTDPINCTAKEAWKALLCTMRILKKGNSYTGSLAYKSLVRPILEYRAACWDPFREGHIKALDHVQKKRQNLQIVRKIRTGKRWRRVER